MTYIPERPTSTDALSTLLMGRETRSVVRSTEAAALKIEGTAAVSRLAMQRTVDLDAERQRLAGVDPGLNALLAEIEVGFVRKALVIQSQMYNPFS